MKSIIILILLLPLTIQAQTTYEQRIKSNVKDFAIVPSYKKGEWSAWQRKEGVEYRYRWGLKTQESLYKTQIDAIFEIKNTTNINWNGAARSLKCDAEQISGFQKTVFLKPNETQIFTFLTPNCETVDNPRFKPNVVKSVRID